METKLLNRRLVSMMCSQVRGDSDNMFALFLYSIARYLTNVKIKGRAC